MDNGELEDLIMGLMDGETITPMEGTVNPGSMMGMAVAFIILGILLTVVRFITRKMQRMRIGWDDWLIVPALVLMLAMCINMITAVGMQRFGYRLPPRVGPRGIPDAAEGYAPEVAQANMFEFTQEVLAPLQLAFAKMSIVLFYRRVLVGTSRAAFHWITLILLFAIVLWGAVFTTLFAFPCGTRWYLIWDGPLQEMADICATGIEGGLVVTDVTLDVIIFVLPVPKIFRLQLSLRKKLLVTAAFLLGALTVVAALIRGLFLLGIIEAGRDTSDVAGEAPLISEGMYWGMLESGLSVIVACLPALQYLVTRSGPVQLLRMVTDGIRSVSQLSFRRASHDVEKADIKHIGLSALDSPAMPTMTTMTTRTSSSPQSPSPLSSYHTTRANSVYAGYIAELDSETRDLVSPLTTPGVRTPRSTYTPTNLSRVSLASTSADFSEEKRRYEMEMF